MNTLGFKNIVSSELYDIIAVCFNLNKHHMTKYNSMIGTVLEVGMLFLPHVRFLPV